MSWKGFQKAVNRAGTSILQTTGVVDKTIDKRYDEEERRFKTLESKVDKLHKEAKGYLESLKEMAVVQSRMAMTIDHFYDETAPLGLAGVKYKDIAESLDNEIRGPIETHYRQTVLEPLSRLCEYFPDFNEVMKKRSKKLLDYDAARSKQKKIADSPERDPSKTGKAHDDLAMTKQVYDSLNDALIDEIPKFIALRVPYLDPSFEALIKIQYMFCRDAVQKLETLQHQFAVAAGHPDPQSGNTDIDRFLEGQIATVLGKMGELSITGLVA